MNKLSNLFYFFITTVFLLISDIYISNLLAHKIESGWGFTNGFINLIFVKNTGAAFSILQHSTKLLIAISIIAIVLITYYIIKNSDILLKKHLLAVAFLSSGILGNLVERIQFGYVRDFFDLSFVNFPIFNISDIFINIGVFVIITMIILTKKPIKL